MAILDVQVLWHQSLFDEYGVRKMCFLTEKNESPPIESHFEHLESNQERSGNHHFGITDQDVVLPKTGDFGLSSYCSNHGQEDNHGEIVEQLNNFLDGVIKHILR